MFSLAMANVLAEQPAEDTSDEELIVLPYAILTHMPDLLLSTIYCNEFRKENSSQ
jgi:hypothetical protein